MRAVGCDHRNEVRERRRDFFPYFVSAQILELINLPRADARFYAFVRVALSYYVASGLIAAIGLLVISAVVGLALGPVAAATAGIAVIVVVPPDLPAPRRGKFWQLLPAIVIAPPLFWAVRTLHGDPWHLAMLLVPATFVAFLGAAWGRRGIPVSMSAMFALVFGMAVPAAAVADGPLRSSGYFALGAVSYLCYATAANALLNERFRVQILADTLFSMASLMRTQGQQFIVKAGDDATNPIGRLLREQAALADQLQGARDLLLESPRTSRRQQLAGMLLRVLEIRDQLLACELDIDELRSQVVHLPLLMGLRGTLDDHAAQLETLADCLLLGRQPAPFVAMRERLDEQPWAAELAAASMLARGLASRVANISDELARLNALARGAAEPELAVVRASWQMFISPVHWSWQPVKGVWRWDAPPLRHALRAATAIGTAFALSRVVPWQAHAYWILLTIVVVLRGSLAQTLERRNNRVAGTLVGSVVAWLLLALQAPALLLTAIVTVAQGVAHAFAVKRYLVTAIAATVLSLLQVHLLNSGVSVAFDAFERIADTLIGVAVAWGFSYVLPAWERTQIPALIERALDAQARHSHASLELGQLSAVDNRPELEWRLARREAYDSLSALVQATQRSLVEPRAVRPPLEPLGRLLAHSYQLLAQLTAVKTMLTLRRGHLAPQQLAEPLRRTMAEIDDTLIGDRRPSSNPLPDLWSTEALALPDPFGENVTPWLSRRLNLAADLAKHVRDDALKVCESARL